MNNNSPEAADAPVPRKGTEQAVEEAAKQPPTAETSAMDTVASVVDGVTDAASVVIDVFSIFE